MAARTRVAVPLEQLEQRAVLTLDFGDAPFSYPVTLAEDGARHTVGSLFLGSQIDAETDGIESASAAGDGADDDGVKIDGGLLPGIAKTIQVTASQAGGLLQGWIDWNADGDWADLGEQIFSNRTLTAGVNTLTVYTPPEAVVGNTFSRFRISSESDLSVTGAASDGEVEDYQLKVTTSGSWTSLGPAGATGGQVEGITNRSVTGPVQTVLAHPTNPDILYVGSVNGGVWKTTNATSVSPTWTPLTDTQASLSIHSLTFDLNDLTYNTIYAGIGKRSSFGQIGGARTGLIRSTDGGQTWQTVNGAGGTLSGKGISGIYANANTVVVSVNVANLFTYSNIGIFQSIDGGATFTKISGGSSTGLPEGIAYHLASDPITPSTLYTSISIPLVAGTQGVYKSTDSGATWTRVSTPGMNSLFTSNTANVKLVVGRSHEVYAAINNSGVNTALFRSPDSGANWTQLDTPVTNENSVNVGLNPGGQGGLHFSITPDPANPNIVYLGGDRQPRSNGDTGGFPNSIGANDFTGRLFRGDASRPAGSQFVHLTHRNNLGASGGGTVSSSAPGANSRDMTFDANGNLIEVDDRGIYRRTSPQNNTGDWFSLIGNLTVADVHDAAWDSLSNTTIAGTEGIGVVRQSSEDAAQWVTVSTFSGGDVAVDNLELAGSGQSVRYSSAQNLGAFQRTVFNAAGQVVSTSFPTRFVVSGSIFNPAFRTPIQTNSVTGGRLLIQGSNSLYESLDGGASMREIGFGRGTGNSIQQDALWYGGTKNNIVNPDLVWAGSGASIVVRTSGTGGVMVVTSPTGGNEIRDLAVNSRDWENAFIISANQVFQTTNTGNTWSNITGNLMTLAADLRSIAFVPGDNVDTIVVGTGSGIFATNTSALGTWYRVGNGMPNALAYELDYDASDDVLIAGTMGRGVWKLTNASIVTAGLAVPTLTVTAPDQAYNNAAYVPTVSATGNNAPGPTVTLEYYSDAAGQNVIAAPENVGTYYVRAFSSANAGNEAAQSAIVEFEITTFALTGSITAANKNFDGTTAATILTRSLNAVFPGDSVFYTGGTARFDTAAFGNGKLVTATGLTLTGADAGNYTVNTTATTTANINPFALTPSVTTASTNEDIQTTAGLVISRNPRNGSEVTHFKITNIQNGSLFLNDGTTPISNGGFITFAQGRAGLKFTPARNLFSPVTNFGFSVQASLNGTNSGLGGSLAAAVINVAAVNDPPSLAIQNAITTLSEDTSTAVGNRLADIVVTDDALGTNVLSLSGPDANSFRIVNNRLFLRSGVLLNFVTKPVYNVTIKVDDATVGSSPDAALGFALNISSFAPTTVNVATPTQDMTPTITWSAIPTAVSYDVSITNVSTNTPLPLRNVTANSYTPATDLGIGRFLVSVRSRNAAGVISRWSAGVNFEINTPVTLNPIARRQGTPRPTITWQRLTGAVRYEIWLGIGASSVIYRDAAVTGTSWTPPSALAIGRYLVWVRGFSADNKPALRSGTGSALTAFLVVPAPRLLSPLHATFDRTPTFRWSSVTGAVSYILRVRNANTGVLVFEQSSTTTSFTPTTSLPDTSYRWDVRAVGAQGEETDFSTSNVLNVGGRPVIFGPTGTAASSTPTLTWSAVQGAVRYELRLDRTDVVQNRLIVETNLTSPSFTPASALAAGSYRFWVRAVSASGEFSPWSNISTFSVAEANQHDQVRPDDMGSEFLLVVLPTFEALSEPRLTLLERRPLPQREIVPPFSTANESVNGFEPSSKLADGSTDVEGQTTPEAQVVHQGFVKSPSARRTQSGNDLLHDDHLFDLVMQTLDLL